MKGREEVIQGFNDLVNLTSSELEEWLESSDSKGAGWSKDSEDGESVGHDSGRKIVQILKDNPDKEPDNYTDDQIDHMRKVVAYCKRHLAQESAGNAEKSADELKKTKSYQSLKNWGHDILKAQKGQAEGSDEANAGDKRTRQNGSNGENKKQKTSKNSSVKDEKNGDHNGSDEVDGDYDEDDDVDGEDVDGEDDDEEDEEGGDEEDEENETQGGKSTRQNGQDKAKSGQNQNGTNGDKKQNGHTNGSSEDQQDGEPKKGDTVSWNWGQGQPEGKVLDVKHEKTSVETKNGNEVSRDGSKEDPAVVLDTGKSKAIKAAHELNETE